MLFSKARLKGACLFKVCATRTYCLFKVLRRGRLKGECLLRTRSCWLCKAPKRALFAVISVISFKSITSDALFQVALKHLREEKKNNGSWVNLKGGGQLSGKSGDGEQMCGMVPRLGSVSGCPRPTPWRRRRTELTDVLVS